MPAKKKFFEVEIPLTNTKVELLTYNIEALDKRTIKLDLTRQLRGKSIEVIFQIKVDEDKAIAEPLKLTLLPFFIRRMLRKSISYVEDSFSAECKDAQLRIKPFLITRKKVSRRVRKALREEAKNWLLDYVRNKSAKDIFSDIIGNRLQKPLSLKLKKIYPLALCEIRMFKIEKLKEQEKLKVTVEKVKGKEEKREEETKENKKEKLETKKDKEDTKEKTKKIEKRENKEETKKQEKSKKENSKAEKAKTEKKND